MGVEAHQLAKLGSVLDHLSLADLQKVSNMVVERMKLRSPAAAIAASASAAASLAPPPVVAAPAPAAVRAIPPGWTPSPLGTRYRGGDLVEWKNTKVFPAILMRGTVKQINAKSISVNPEGGTPGSWWRIHPSFLRLVGQHPSMPAAPAPAPVLSEADLDHLFGRKSHVPTAEGAGAW